MKDSKGYIRAKKAPLSLGVPPCIVPKPRKGDPFLAHTPIPPEAHQGADPATAPDGRTFGLCGAPDPATEDEDALDLRALVRVLRFEIAPALWEIARAVRIAEALDAPPFSPCAPRKRARRTK